MSHLLSPEQVVFEEEFLHYLAELAQVDAQSHLLERIDQVDISAVEAAMALADAALTNTENAPQKATQWLELAQTLYTHSPQPAVAAQISYAQARLYLQQGQLSAAEESLQHAQVLWQSIGDDVSAARTVLGLTQILTLQGNYTDAQRAISKAIIILHAAIDTAPSYVPLLIAALRNQANLFGYLHNHHRALEIYEQAQQIVDRHRSKIISAVSEPQLAYEEACISYSRAVDLMALARLQEAEQALTTAIQHFERSGDHLHGSHAHSNLASLYARTGQYRQALAAYEQAIEILWGKERPLEALPVEELQAADVMLLDQALVFLALNLQSAAMHSLLLAEKLFTYAQRPYELGQTLYAKGLLHIQEQDEDAATATLERAQATFEELQNHYWRNRAIMARIALLQQQRDFDRVGVLLAPLIDGDPTALDEQWYGWDLATATELYLLQLQIFLQLGKITQARASATTIEQLFHHHFANVPSVFDENEPTANFVSATDNVVAYGVPHLRFAHLYAQGRIERAAGALLVARSFFQRAVTLLEAQRATLPLEELRIAFLGDKAAIYSDWLLTFLDLPELDSAGTRQAFAIIERARSRTLLERLLATLDDSTGIDSHSQTDQIQGNNEIVLPNSDGHVSFAVGDHESVLGQTHLAPALQQDLLRRHLHWLYNQLLDQEGTRQSQGEQLQMIRRLEYRLEQLESKSVLPTTAIPVTVDELQAVLQPDEQVLAYYIAGDEILLFLVTSAAIQIFRHLCSVPELMKAHRDFLFQMGRVQSSDLYLQELNRRSRRQLTQALQRFGQLLLEPVLPYLLQKRLQIIPFGPLHQLPFHAFQLEDRYLIEIYDCQYIPSASIAVHQQASRSVLPAGPVWSGIAVTDQGIPETANEINMVADLFRQPQIYLGKDAGKAGLKEAAAVADILHVSTHGLMRNDNPLFSSLKLADGWIDVREIYRLDLRAQLVVLSACRSGSSQVSQGDEVLGLVRGFLGAGAQTLLVSQWDVNDSYAPTFMAHFYRQLLQSGQDPATALRHAQCHAIAEGHHPFWWAPFFVIG